MVFDLKITLKEGQNLWLTSDTHYGHANICRGTSKWSEGQTRNFNTIDEMNEFIVKQINDNVKTDDYFLHGGDFSFGGFENIEIFRSRINCKNIIHVPGNHDQHIINNKNNVQDLFKFNLGRIANILIRIPQEDGRVKKIPLVVSHYPLGSWEEIGSGMIHIHGHLHSKGENRFGYGRSFDFGFDGHPENRPYELFELLKLVGDRKIISNLTKQIDHHTT
jgi:calcineurin-like phosphoesterase family protein